MQITEKLLKVQWLDAKHSSSEAWLNEKDIPNLAAFALENVGYGFIKDNGDVVICSQKSMEEDGSYGPWWLIPSAYITRIVELKEGLPLKDVQE